MGNLVTPQASSPLPDLAASGPSSFPRGTEGCFPGRSSFIPLSPGPRTASQAVGWAEDGGPAQGRAFWPATAWISAPSGRGEGAGAAAAPTRAPPPATPPSSQGHRGPCFPRRAPPTPAGPSRCSTRTSRTPRRPRTPLPSSRFRPARRARRRGGAPLPRQGVAWVVTPSRSDARPTCGAVARETRPAVWRLRTGGGGERPRAPSAGVPGSPGRRFRGGAPGPDRGPGPPTPSLPRPGPLTPSPPPTRLLGLPAPLPSVPGPPRSQPPRPLTSHPLGPRPRAPQPPRPGLLSHSCRGRPLQHALGRGRPQFPPQLVSGRPCYVWSAIGR
ncbi:PREDICTED: vegetative cell wall protein gp1-like [Dipodomys ordii]|uniref:Vegetative cell wall protein gp1-like n=1 Tax=Dipodomys ordii TaxID=10020 RepID=A0A1S3F5Q9_DIPOR|nr:PREDICTED: vegetative cell wall protein gp1-like [Dipodomys ordii]